MLALLLIGDAIALWTYRRDANTAVLRRLVPSVLARVGLGALLLAVSTQAQMRRAIGAILLFLVIVTRAQRRWGPPRVSQGRVARATYGTLACFTTMAANAGGPVTSMYFLASRFSVSEFLGTTAWFFFTVNVIKAPFTIGMGPLRLEHLPLIGVLVPVVLACAWAGRCLAAHIPLRIFEPLVIATTIVATVPLLLKKVSTKRCWREPKARANNCRHQGHPCDKRTLDGSNANGSSNSKASHIPAKWELSTKYMK